MSEDGQQLGKYQLQRHIATGGMAEIWLAEQAGPGGFNKELVIKRILSHFADDEQFTRMFLDEARLAAQLSHPKIAQIYELGEIDGEYFIAMEYIQGIDLDVLLKMAMEQGAPMPVGIVAKIMMDVLEALDYAHGFTDRTGQPYNLVHRDVSPHNVLISNDGIVKLCDFGVAKAKANQTRTQPGAVKGKFAYMAPEQIQNAHEVDRRADVFAAGILFYELLTGKKPFGDELAAVNNIIAQRHPDPRSLREDIPPGIVAIVDRALEKRPEDRYPDAHSMMREIQNFVRNGGDFVGDRELSRYVREMQGLPVTRHSQPAVPVEGPAIDPLSDTGEQPLERRPTTTQEPNVTAQLYGGDEDAVEPAPAPQKSNAGLYAVFAFIIVSIIVALALIAFFVVGPGEPAVDTVDAPTQPVAAAQKGNPSLLKRGGGPVIISTTPKSDIYVDGQLVGSTPFDAQLPPGKYQVEFRTRDGKKRKTETLVVEGKGFETLKFKL